MSVPERPDDAIEPPKPKVRMGPSNALVSFSLPKANAALAVVHLEGKQLHINTLTQRPRYYYTLDLSDVVCEPLQLDEEKVLAEALQLHRLQVVIPMKGTREQIEEARVKGGFKRFREQGDGDNDANDNDKRKKSKKKKNNNDKKNKNAGKKNQAAAGGKKKNKKKNGGDVVVASNKVTEAEVNTAVGVAEDAWTKRETQIQAKVEKQQQKEAWIQKQEKIRETKKRAKPSSALREIVEEAVREKFSVEGKKKAQKEKKIAKKQKQEKEAKDAVAASKKKSKRVSFA